MQRAGPGDLEGGTDLTMKRRTIAIGDIHGCSRALAVLIEAVRPTPADTVVPLGDFVDRGPDSRGVIDRLIDLGRRCRLVPILGNHEQMLLDAWDRRSLDEWTTPGIYTWIAAGGMATLDSYGPTAILDDLPEDHLRFLRDCYPYFEDDTHLFVHANYQPDLDLSKQTTLMLRWESLRDFRPSVHRSGKTAVVGHTPQKSGEVLDLGHLKCIDTHCYGGGWLTALETATGRYWQSNQTGELKEGCLRVAATE